MKIWEAVKIWFVKVFGTSLIAWLAYRKGQTKIKKGIEENYEENQKTKKTIIENLKNSPKYKRLFDKMKFMSLFVVFLLPSCVNSPDYNKNYCHLYTVIQYEEGDVVNLLTEYQIELNNKLHEEVCK